MRNDLRPNQVYNRKSRHVPRDMRKEYPFPSPNALFYSCNFIWVAGEWEPCSKTCGSNGFQSRELYCLPQTMLRPSQANSSNGDFFQRHMVSPVKCGSSQLATVRPCNRIPCPSQWEFGDWSQVWIGTKIFDEVFVKSANSIRVLLVNVPVKIQYKIFDVVTFTNIFYVKHNITTMLLLLQQSRLFLGNFEISNSYIFT